MSDADPILWRRPTLNPYLSAASLIYMRLKWDLKLQSWSSRAKLKQLKDSYKGRTAVICCNGPSLLKVDFSLLEDHFVFGLNKINLLFDKTEFRPSSIVAVNSLVLEQNSGFYNTTSIPLFLDQPAHRFIKNRENVTFLHSSDYPKFARDCSMSIYQGFTVTFVAMQLAYHMGFSRVALVGCDHSFSAKGPANAEVNAGASDPDHFDPNYFSGDNKWHLPDLFQSEVYYMLAKQTFEASGRKIYNCTDGGKLEMFPRMHLSEFT